MNMKRSQSFSTRGASRGGKQRINNNFNRDYSTNNNNNNNNNNFMPKSNSYQSFTNNSNQHIQSSTQHYQGYRHQQFMNYPPPPPPLPQQFPYYPQQTGANNGFFMPPPSYPYYQQHQYQTNYPPVYNNGMMPFQPQPSPSLPIPQHAPLAHNNQFYSQGPMTYSNKNFQSNSFNRVNTNNINNNKNVKNNSSSIKEIKKPLNEFVSTENFPIQNKNIIKKSF